MKISLLDISLIIIQDSQQAFMTQTERDSKHMSRLSGRSSIKEGEEKVELQALEEYQDIVEVASQSLAYRSLLELKQILGIHQKDYKRLINWLCLFIKIL